MSPSIVSAAVALPAFKPPAYGRSRNMAAIRSRGNRTTEQRLRALLIRVGLRGWIIGGGRDIGCPDFVFERQKVAVFVDGCFWHGCRRCGHVPRTNTPYWAAKIARNQRRDRRISKIARGQGYVVIRIWECQLRQRGPSCTIRIQAALRARADTHAGLGQL